MNHSSVDCIVIGAGVIGLACARALAMQNNNKTVYVLEAETQAGMHISSRNSGVIHSGIYYPKDFLKTQLCIEGNRLLKDYCQQHNIAHNYCGKLIVATNEDQFSALEALHQQGLKNGISGIKLIEKNLLKLLEPELDALAALYVKNTGIVDAQALMQQLEADISHSGSQVLYKQRVTHIEQANNNSGFTLTVNNNGDELIHCKQLIIAAGLSSQQLSTQLGLAQHTPKLHYCKGHYFSYQGTVPFKHLVYPMPDNNKQGLGIHATLDCNNQLRFGPDVFHQDDDNLHFQPTRKKAFIKAIKKYWPALDEHKLQEDYVGIRPKIQAPNEPAQDFIIQTEQDHGIKNLVQLFGIESPGLTASLAIGEKVAKVIC